MIRPLYLLNLSIWLSVLMMNIMSVKASGIYDDEKWHVTHYDDHNGLSQWHVTKMLQDKRGYMWFSSWNGLNRYDGYNFTVFKSQPGDGTTLTSDRIRNILIGDDGNIYCIINDDIWRFNLRNYKFEKPDATTCERYRTKLKIDTSVSRQHYLDLYGHHFDNARQMLTDMQGNIWVMEKYGVYKLSRKVRTAKKLSNVPEDIIRCIFTDNKKRIWVTARNTGIVTVLDSLANFIGYLGADGRLHASPSRFASVFCMAQQRNGTIWLGTKPDGLYKLKEVSDGVFSITHLHKGSAIQVRRGETLNSDAIYDIKEDRRGRLWIATHGGGINLMEYKGGEMRFRNKENTFSHYPIDNVNVRRLELVGDTVLLATTTEGFMVVTGIQDNVSKAGFKIHLREPHRSESLSCSAVMDMLVDRKGRLFLSTESGGVNMLLTKDLSSSVFSFRHFNISNGMGSDVALAMTEFGDEILIQCNNQITRLNADTGIIENFNSLFFAVTSNFSDAEPLLLCDGRWLLSLENGVMMIPEQSFKSRSYTPRIAITSYSIPGSLLCYAVDDSDTIRLSSSERNVTIEFAAIDFSDNSHIKYVTRVSRKGKWLEKTDTTGWSIPNDTRTVNFFDLSPGIYRLEIRSTNAEGLWTDNNRVVYIEVEPTFWETPFAYIIYVLLIVGTISAIIYTVFYIKTLKRQRKENLEAYLRIFEQSNNIGMEISGDTVGSQVTIDENTNIVQQGKETSVSLMHISQEDNDFMSRLLSFVDDNLANSDICIDDMALATATSRSSLNRKTKMLLGVTPADFLKEARMKRACNLLLTTTKNINDIAYSCGFSDSKYFSKCFKVCIGISPSEYRMKQK
ncbi:MAG: helix-turn-helix domain-containing protein [Prevotella sp.]